MSRVEQSLLLEENFSKPAKTGLSASDGEDSNVISQISQIRSDWCTLYVLMLRLMQSYRNDIPIAIAIQACEDRTVGFDWRRFTRNT